MPNKLTYAEKRARGLCGRCGVESADPYCERCLALRKGYREAARAARAKKGLCKTCGVAKRARGKANCADCQEKNNALSRTSHAKARAEDT